MGNHQRTLEGQVALVTGSSRGLGRAIALRLAQEGAKVIITYRQEKDRAQAVYNEILSRNGDSLCVSLDVTDRSSIRTVINNTLDLWGKLNILVNNAGYLEQKPFNKITDSDWDYMLACNLKSVFMCTQEMMPIFEQQRTGAIINITSVGGQSGGTKALHYAAAKAGVISLTRSLAKIFAPYEVRVNAVAPGFINTDMYKDIITRESEEVIISGIPLARIGEPEDVASAVAYLASEDSKYITGQVLNVNGGLYLG